MKRAVFPGSFDPFTNGHLDIVKRASSLFDEVIILVANNSNKSSLFTPEERVLMISKAVYSLKNVLVDSSSSLVVDYCSSHDAGYIIRGIRNERDLNYEMEIEVNNRFLSPQIETIYLTSSQSNLFVRSSSIKEFIKYGRNCRAFVPEEVYSEIEKKFLLK